MAVRIYPIWHKGKKIYFTDRSNLSDTETAINTIEETTSFIEQNNEKNLLELLDVRGSYASSKILMKLKNAAKRTKQFSKRKAIVGVTGSKRVLLIAVNRFIDGNIKGFENVDRAKEWLTTENN